MAEKRLRDLILLETVKAERQDSNRPLFDLLDELIAQAKKVSRIIAKRQDRELDQK